MEIIKQKKIALIFLALGAIGGFLYWKFVGCTSGTCAIKSVWYWSTLWGAAVGYLLGDFINDLLVRVKKKKGNKDDREVQ
ncbi:DUF6132 family protein [Maribellus sp. YY47]|uniref:DUF6132 family protein n=1 Tax=Maribellus sp. YY47 TaxID=2929486 RepID=UPI00200109D5|nr:DUF6132 family protein [Maribellus sp. YY47]MCK3684097.1 DUF6132 family protein [Maribellus sp. YY47]